MSSVVYDRCLTPLQPPHNVFLSPSPLPQGCANFSITTITNNWTVNWTHGQWLHTIRDTINFKDSVGVADCGGSFVWLLHPLALRVASGSLIIQADTNSECLTCWQATNRAAIMQVGDLAYILQPHSFLLVPFVYCTLSRLTHYHRGSRYDSKYYAPFTPGILPFLWCRPILLLQQVLLQS